MFIKEYPLQRAGISLHLDCCNNKDARRSILLVHGVTYSSHEFDIHYQDYSLVQKLVNEGYFVWRLDIAGYGRSGEVEDGFLPDSDYAVEDICVAAELIIHETGQAKIDVFGWSWGTVTASRFSMKHPEHVNKLILYAPIVSGLGKQSVSEPFHHNTWETAAEDFQRSSEGIFDPEITDPVVIELWCSSCWHYDGERSPNAGRRDICVDQSEILIDFSGITVPTLVICGDKDPYLNYRLIDSCLNNLPGGSSLEKIKGAAHCAFVEKPYYHDFHNRLLRFLRACG